MIKFNELRLSDDKTTVDIDLKIEDLSIYSGLHIEKIYINYYKNFKNDGPGDYAVTLYELEDGGEELRKWSGSFSREEYLDPTDEESFLAWPSDLANQLFYVYVECGGDYDLTEIPEEELVTVGVCIDWETVYRQGLQMVKSIISNCGNICDPKCGWADFIFRWHALKLGVATSDYSMINEMWPLLFNREKKVASTSCCFTTPKKNNCGC